MTQLSKRKSRLLVVDDDNDFRRFVTDSLTDEGFDVHDVSTGSAALDAAKNLDFDLILLDIKMPVMDGIQTLKLLRQETPSTDFMMITGYQDVNLAVESIRLGAKEYLTKPIDPSDLILRVKSALRAHDAEVRLKELQANFSSRLLYELRTPIQTIKSAVDFLNKGVAGPITDQQQDVLNHISTTVGKMFTLLNDMIDLSKFESGKVDLEKLPTNLDELIPAICSRSKPQATAKNLSLIINVEASVPTIELDADKMEQVVTNLLDNAIKYTNDGGTIKITASVVQRKLAGKNRDLVEVAVSDTGAGISKEELPFVFDKYKEFLTGKSSEQKTTGIGLAICRSIVQAHSGTMTVESELGKGSTFKFYLPVE